MRILTFLVSLVLAGTLYSQNIIETFSYPNGTKVPGWTQQWLTWKIQNGRLVTTGGRSFHYITNDKLKGITDCVLDIEVIYPAVVSLHLGGLCARHPGGPGENGLIQLKLQDNASAGNFNTLWLYERPGGATLTNISPTTKRAIVRLFVKGKQAWAMLDGDMNGTFEFKSAVRNLSSTTKLSGLVGICGYNAVELDNWKYYAGMLLPALNSTPKIGGSYTMEFFAPLEGGTTPRPTPWIAMMSLGNKGVHFGDGRGLPLNLDWFWAASFGFGWTGVLSPTSPSAKFSLPIPNDPILVGLNLFAGAMTLTSPLAFGIGAISNDHHFQLTK